MWSLEEATGSKNNMKILYQCTNNYVPNKCSSRITTPVYHTGLVKTWKKFIWSNEGWLIVNGSVGSVNLRGLFRVYRLVG